jgi:hypothetical protein
MIFTLIYFISAAYCLFKLAKRNNDRSLGGGIGETPGLDTLMVLVLAPFLAICDLVISFINFLKRWV